MFWVPRKLQVEFDLPTYTCTCKLIFVSAREARAIKASEGRLLMQGKKILVIEDDKDIQGLITYNLEKENYEVTGALSGDIGLSSAKTGSFDLILLDLMLPGIDGLEICRALKADPRARTVPIIIVTAKGEEADIVLGLELGADDYIVKPFSPKVLTARVKAILRRHDSPKLEKDQVIRAGQLQIHPGKREVLMEDKPVELTFTEFEILRYLAGHPGWVFTRYQIVNALKGEDYPVTDRSVDVQIAGLRKKLGPSGELIETIRGVGYRFKDMDL